MPVNSLIVFEEDVIRYYSVQNNILMFNEIKDVDYNSQIIIKNIEEALDQNSQKVDKEYNYEELLTRLGIIENAKNDVEKEEIIKEIDRIFDLVKPESKKDMGKIMKEANVSLKGKADFKLVSEIVNSKLGA